MESIDITSNGLREQGYTLKKEGLTIVLQSSNGSRSYRFAIYKTTGTKL
jgi:hypothetical protein